MNLALIRQCGIQLPPSYFGYDYVIPVCLKDGTITFVGIQIKRANADLMGHVFSMQSRLHLVKCSNIDCTTNSGKTKTKKATKCDFCMKNKELETIYNNQVSILLSLDDKNSYDSFTGNISFFNGCFKSSEKILTRFLRLKKTKKKEFKLSTDSVKIDNFLLPLINERIPLKNNVLISNCLWNDEYVSTKAIFIGKDGKKIKFMADGYVHRQFCICSRGWYPFSRLFQDFDSSINIANEILVQDDLLKNVERVTPDLIRQVIYHLSLKFPEYSDDLRLMRNKSSYMDKFELAVEPRILVKSKKIVNDYY